MKKIKHPALFVVMALQIVLMVMGIVLIQSNAVMIFQGLLGFSSVLTIYNLLISQIR